MFESGIQHSAGLIEDYRTLSREVMTFLNAVPGIGDLTCFILGLRRPNRSSSAKCLF
ncbi:MAG: hypothetical protein HC842_04475 [Cytophagales bacterium]|nr:hypothetical protein [Cytophagales bacterium]